MNNCQDCSIARTALHYGGFRASCRGCQARAASRSPEFFEAKAAGGKPGPARDKYLSMIERLGLSHDEVRTAWAEDASNA